MSKIRKVYEYTAEPGTRDQLCLAAARALKIIGEFFECASCRVVMGVIRRTMPAEDFDKLFGEDSDDGE